LKKFYIHILYLLLPISLWAQTGFVKPGKTTKGNLMYNNANAMLREKNYQQALFFLQQAIAEEKDNYIFQREYANTFLINKQAGNAALIIEQALLLPDADEDGYYLAYIAFSTANNIKKAEQLVQVGLSKYPKSGRLTNAYASLLFNQAMFNQAYNLWNQTIDTTPYYYETYNTLAKVLDSQLYYLPQQLILMETYLVTSPYSETVSMQKQKLYQLYNLLYTQYLQPKAKGIKGPPKKRVAMPNQYLSYLQVNKKNKYLLLTGLQEDDFYTFRKSVVEDYVALLSEEELPILFKYLNRLNQANLLDVYNKWLFGRIINLSSYNDWASSHIEELEKLDYFFKNIDIKSL
jgi:hypothetical protein